MRLSIKKELTKAKLVLQSFLLRHDKKFTEEVTWTLKHRAWLRNIHFDEEYLNEAFNEYIISVNSLEQILKIIKNRLKEISQNPSVKKR